MTKEKLHNILLERPVYRERKNKNLLFAQILQREYPKLEEIEVHNLASILVEYATMDRDWRKLLEKYPMIRGSDYGKKKNLVDKKLQELYN